MIYGRDRGFTLLELMVALVVFSLIAAVCYTALVPAGEGFRMLQAQRDILESSYQMDRRLRMDAAYLTRPADSSLKALVIVHDQRGADAFDTLSMMVADGDSLLPVWVRYSLDEESGNLLRESSMLLLRSSEPVRWQMQAMSSFEVQALNQDGLWVDSWDQSTSNILPAALRVRWHSGTGLERELLLPIPIGLAARAKSASAPLP